MEVEVEVEVIVKLKVLIMNGSKLRITMKLY